MTSPAAPATTPGPGVTRVVLADDQPLMRAGLRTVLTGASGVEVVGEAATGTEAVDAVRRLRPDVVVMDVRMPGLDGIAATRRIVDEGLATRVLVLTTFDAEDFVADALRAGAAGFLLKHVAARHLVEAVQAVARGDSVLSPEVTGQVIRAFREGPGAGRGDRSGSTAGATAGARGPGAGRPGGLSPREVEVLQLLARGLSNHEIASRLYLAESTVKTHVRALLAKIGARDRVQAAYWWHERSPGGPGP